MHLIFVLLRYQSVAWKHIEAENFRSYWTLATDTGKFLPCRGSCEEAGRGCRDLLWLAASAPALGGRGCGAKRRAGKHQASYHIIS